jgi:hypothetical protein
VRRVKPRAVEIVVRSQWMNIQRDSSVDGGRTVIASVPDVDEGAKAAATEFTQLAAKLR